MFSQPGNPSSNPSKSLFLFSKPSSCSVFQEGRKQLAAPAKQQPLKSAHPSMLWDSKYLSVRHLSVNYLAEAPTSMLVGAKLSWLQLSIVGKASRTQVTASPMGPNITAQIFTHCLLPFLTSALPPQQHPPPPIIPTQTSTYAKTHYIHKQKPFRLAFPPTFSALCPPHLTPPLTHLYLLGCWNIPPPFVQN